MRRRRWPLRLKMILTTRQPSRWFRCWALRARCFARLHSDRAFQIAVDYDQPRAYDAAYAAHAEARGLKLITTDKPFFEALNGVKRPQKMPPLSFVKLLA